MNPFMSAGTASNTEKQELPEFKELDWDFNRNTYVYRPDGSHVVVTRNEALKIWIRKALLVERYRYRAYFDDYGAELEHFTGTVPNDGIEEVEVFRYIQEALLVNPYITEINDISFSQEKKKITMQIDVTTVYGKETVGIEV